MTQSECIQKLIAKNKKIIVVSSGAIALGCIKMNYDKILKSRHPTDLAPQTDLCRF